MIEDSIVGRETIEEKRSRIDIRVKEIEWLFGLNECFGSVSGNKEGLSELARVS